MRLAPVLGLSLVVNASALAQSPPVRSTAIVGVTVVDVERGQLRPNQVIVVAGTRIVSVQPVGRGTGRAPTTDTIIATGRFVIPGLWDMHVHSAYPLFPAIMGPQYIANGVTGVREMFGDLGVVRQWRQTLTTADTLWPRIVASGHIVDGNPPIWPTSVLAGTAAEGAHAVDSLKAAGADFIKVYSLLPRAAYQGIAQRAKAVGIPFVGHVTYAINAFEASNAGQASIEHMDGVLRACSSEDAATRPAVAALVERGAGFDSLLAVSRPQASLLRSTTRDSTCNALAATFVRNKTYLSPTLTVLHGMGWADDTTQLADPRLRYLPKFLWRGWTPANDFRLKSITTEGWVGLKADFTRNQEMVAYMHRRGVQILAGTDMLNPWVFPGWSLHDELARYVDAGLSPLAALQTATVNPARFLHATDSLGTIAQGKLADFVLLEANPLQDIRNTQKIAGVMANGRWVSPVRRQQLLDAVEQMVKPAAPRRP